MPRPSTAEVPAPVQVSVRVAAGSLRDGLAPAYVVPHAWTADGVSVDGDGTGAHLLLTAAACCVLNDVYREAAEPALPIAGVRVSAVGGFDAATWSSATIAYDVDVDTPAGAPALAALLARVDDVAEIPRVLRGDIAVTRGRSTP